MALSLNDVKNKKSKSQKSREDLTSQTKNEDKPHPSPQAEVQDQDSPLKVRPWQTPEPVAEEAPPDFEPNNFKAKPKIDRSEWDEWMQKAELLKNIGLASLPPEIEKFVKDSWVEKIQLYPKVKIPVPSVFTRKTK